MFAYIKAKDVPIKTKIKHYTPEILVGVTVVAGIAAALYIRKDLQSGPVIIDLTRDAWEAAKSGVPIGVETDYGTFVFAKLETLQQK